MDPPPNQQAAAVNLTRVLEALSPYINNPRQTVVRIEVFVLAAVGLLFLQLLLGSIRRRCGHWSVQGILWVAYTAFFPLVTYTLGQMVSSPIKNAFYPIWALFLLWAAGCTNSIIAYDLEDNNNWKRHLFELIQYFVYFAIILRQLGTTSNTFEVKKNQQGDPIVSAIVFLLMLLVYANVVRLIAGWMVTNSDPSKSVADYMRKQAASAKGNQQETFDPVTMKGYKYLVLWPRRHKNGSGIVTIDKIWEMEANGSLLNLKKGGLGAKDLCLSFALSHLLKRRYFKMECAEANRPEARKFVLEGLLPEKEADNNYTRAFQIIEAELGFLYDFFFTKYATLFHMEITYLVIAVLKLIFLAYFGVVLLTNLPTINTLVPIIEVGTRRFDVTITKIIMLSFSFVEALQLIFYVTSDWATVSLACLCIRTSNSECIRLSLIRFLRRFKVITHAGYWQNKMGQSSVIASSMHSFSYSIEVQYYPDLLLSGMIRFAQYISNELFPSMIFSGKTSVQVPDLVKTKIVSCLKEYKVDAPLTNGERALRRNGIFEDFSWTLKNQSQTSIMLVWHIATEYCSIPFSSELENKDGAGIFAWHQIFCGFWTKENESSGNQQVATTLSRYCAYLMSFVPDLLPGNSADTLFTLKGVIRYAHFGKSRLYKTKASKELSPGPSQESKRHSNETMIHDSRGNDDDIINVPDSNDDNNTDEIISVHDSSDDNTAGIIFHDYSTDNINEIFIQGLKLGKQLEEEIKNDDERWRMLAEFWAETIIYIAPSDNAKAHMERLAQGGEFLTHVWALLTHAGILQRGKKETDTPEDIPNTNV